MTRPCPILLVGGLAFCLLISTNGSAAEPLALKDKALGFIFYLESNRQNCSAIDEEGRIHWRLNVAKHAKAVGGGGEPNIKIFANATPDALFAAGIAPMSQDYLMVVFDTGEVGLLHRRTARYIAIGP